MTLYTDEVRQIVHSVDWDNGLYFEIRENPGWLSLVVFRENFDPLPDPVRQRVAEKIQHTLSRVNSTGIPMRFEVEKNVPR